MPLRILTFFGITALSLIIAGCAGDTIVQTPVKTVSQNDAQWQQHLIQLHNIKQYQAQGQLGYISAKERFSTQFDWQYVNDSNYQLFLSSGLSRETLTLKMTPMGLVVSDNKGNQRTEKDAHILLQEIVGMDFPIELFSYWLKGEPKGTQNYKVRSTDHLLNEFDYTVNGQRWIANYGEYHAGTPPLPQNIVIQGDAKQLKVRVDKWTF
ncbi:lipoprotein insertase outer membrane protein LolB [Spirabiliibacterium falconis]|uniref:lipoprotein insertase outer membrane protein LolB n=1 Tax=Spirabiliibacterium falconis TaxID=572023 RepID=UPI001AAD2506|nr:lipoprotein insertase outer membrane protein LolB [Spirabiliibacterium falconis]MBE2893855.1 lipoprotein localization protein LolB [Spirabiliibacterium falconis]